METVAFFDPEIIIEVTSATRQECMRTMSIGEFAGTNPVSLYKVGDEYEVRKLSGDFIRGKEVID